MLLNLEMGFEPREDPLEEGIATHSSILASRTPWTEEPGKLEPMGLQSQTQLKSLSMHKADSRVTLCSSSAVASR